MNSATAPNRLVGLEDHVDHAVADDQIPAQRHVDEVASSQCKDALEGDDERVAILNG